MKEFSQYDKATGMFTSHIVRGMKPAETDSHGWKEGMFNHANERLDLASDRVVPFEDVRPTDARRNHRRALSMIAELERRQARRVRELMAESDPILQEIDAEIANLRADLQKQD